MNFQKHYEAGSHYCFVDVDGVPGWMRKIEARALAEFTFNVDNPALSNVFPSELYGTGKGKRATNYRYYTKAHTDAWKMSQSYGNCTAVSLAELMGASWEFDRVVKGEAHIPMEYRPGSALYYAARGHRGQGMALSTAGNCAVKVGISLRKPYCNGEYDLSDENDDEAYGNKWYRGAPDCVVDEVKTGGKIATYKRFDGDDQTVLDTLYNGAFLHNGSTNTGGDGDPVGRLKRIGGHAQGIIGYDDTDEFREFYQEKTGKRLREAVVIWDQTWGNWNSVSNWPEHLWGEKPEGAWVITLSDTMKMVRQGTYVCWDVLGFILDNLPNWGATEVLG